jgi:DUF4097 and DUF4098 domain-containing protein YvlB
MSRLCLIPAIALISAATLATPAVASEQQETERIDRTVPIRANGHLRLKNFSGRISITGTNRADVSVHAVRRASRDRLDHIKLDIAESGSGVTIEANRKDDSWRDRDNNVVDTEFDIEVPSDISLEVDAFSSNVDVKDVRGDQRVHTFSGAIDVSDAWGSVDAETFSGNVTVKLAASAGGRVEFDSFSGSLRSDAALTYRSGSRRRITGDIGTGGNNDYHFKTFSGDVRIR